jgi:hypothetical protein
MKMRDDFAVFILTHGRPNNIITLKTLKKCGYTGKYYIVIDNEDDTENEYRKLYGDKVIQFDKLAISKTFDTMDNSQERRTIVYARNVCFELAKELGLKYFLELDDDYTSFEYRFINENKKNRLDVKKVTDINSVFNAMINFLNDTNAETVCFAQGGDFIGGLNGGNYSKKVLRKTMNSFFCRTDKPFNFIGRINEDVNTYTYYGSIGWLGLSITDCSLVQKRTQKNKGGMSDVYLDSGTYLKSFYSVMCMPSAVKIMLMGDSHLRLHHNINWECCVPKILDEKYKKI